MDTIGNSVFKIYDGQPQHGLLIGTTLFVIFGGEDEHIIAKEGEGTYLISEGGIQFKIFLNDFHKFGTDRNWKDRHKNFRNIWGES